MKALVLFSLLTSFACAKEKSLFNGKDLTGWDGNPELWSVVDGVIVGKTVAEKPIEGNTFLIWKDGEVSDFEITLKYKMTGPVNSGIQYRSEVKDPAKWSVGGYQADFEAGKTYSGILYEEQGRGILAKRGEKVKITQSDDPSKPNLEITGETGKSEDIQAAIDDEGWNEYKVIAKGNHLQHFINGKLTVDVTDETKEGAKKGVLALQLHAGPPMQVEFKDIVLKED